MEREDENNPLSKKSFWISRGYYFRINSDPEQFRGSNL